MRLTVIALAMMAVAGCAARGGPPARLVLAPDAAFQADGAAVDMLREAASWWSAVGVDARVELGTVAGAVIPVVAAPDGYPLSCSDEAIGCGSELGISVLAGFVNNPRPVAVNLLAHEIGHALGLQHLPEPDAVMFPSMHGSTGITDADAAEYFSVHP